MFKFSGYLNGGEFNVHISDREDHCKLLILNCFINKFEFINYCVYIYANEARKNLETLATGLNRSDLCVSCGAHYITVQSAFWRIIFTGRTL